MRFHNLRIAWSAAWGAVALFICVLWLRSYSGRTGREVLVTSTHRYQLLSWHGSLIALQRVRVFISIEASIAYPDDFFSDLISKNFLGVGYYVGDYFVAISASYWMLGCICGVAAAVPWLRFSLRTLLVAMTLVAVALGLSTWAWP